MVAGQGRYSIIRNEWDTLPGDAPESDEACVQRKASSLRATIEEALDVDDPTVLARLLERIHAFRTHGVASALGEFSLENLVYKLLRNDGTIEKLKEAAIRSYDESLSYAQKYAKWMPYTGPRGGRGWQNTETGEKFYGSDPPGERKAAQPDDIGEPNHAADTINQVTADLRKSLAGRSGRETGTPKPKAGGKTGLSQKLDSAEFGTEIEGWTKTDIPEMNMSGWSNGETMLTDEQMLKFNNSDVANHFKEQEPEQPQAASPQKPAKPARPAKPPVRSKTSAASRPFTDDEKQSIHNVAKVFGIAPGDIRNDARLQQFLKLTARNVGFDPETAGPDLTDQALASAEYLNTQSKYLEHVVEMAKAYKWKGGTGRELAVKSRNAAHHLLKTATAQGYQPTGDSQKDIEGAINFLQDQETEQPGDNNAITDILKMLLQKPEKISAAHVVGAVLGFWLAYRTVRRRKRSRR